MEAAGRNNVMVQALLSRGINVAVTRKHGDRGGAVQVDPMKPTLKAPGTQRLKV
jgi:hypothetical protein